MIYDVTSDTKVFARGIRLRTRHGVQLRLRPHTWFAVEFLNPERDWVTDFKLDTLLNEIRAFNPFPGIRY